MGLDNYRDALRSGDFWSAVKTTFIFTAISVTLELVHRDGDGPPDAQRIPRPSRVARRRASALGDPDGRDRDHVALILSPTSASSTRCSGTPPSRRDTVWLAQNGYALAVMVFADVWKTAPFMALLLLAGLQVIPDDLYDAAKVDGATAWQRFV